MKTGIFGRAWTLMKLLALVALTVIAHLGAALAREPIATVPYFIDEEGAMNVAVRIDGRGPYNFIIDTGATLTLAFENLAAIEGFAPTGGARRRVLGITGSATLDTYQLGDISIGPAMLRDHIGVILPDWMPPRKTPAGVLGIDFFREYAVVFDTRARTISLYPHGGIPKEQISKWRSIKLRPKTYVAASGALYTAAGSINRSPTTFIIDLGSVATLVNYEAAEALYAGVLTSGAGGSLTTGSRLKDIFDDRTLTRTAEFERIQIGGALWRKVVVWLKDAQIFEELGIANEPYALLGADLLAAQDFAIDFGENRLYLSKLSRKKR